MITSAMYDLLGKHNSYSVTPSLAVICVEAGIPCAKRSAPPIGSDLRSMYRSINVVTLFVTPGRR
jgi:hypothetical protein